MPTIFSKARPKLLAKTTKSSARIESCPSSYSTLAPTTAKPHARKRYERGIFITTTFQPSRRSAKSSRLLEPDTTSPTSWPHRFSDQRPRHHHLGCRLATKNRSNQLPKLEPAEHDSLLQNVSLGPSLPRNFLPPVLYYRHTER